MDELIKRLRDGLVVVPAPSGYPAVDLGKTVALMAEAADALADARKTIESLEKTIGEIVAGLAWAESHESEWGVAEVLAIARSALSPREGEG